MHVRNMSALDGPVPLPPIVNKDASTGRNTNTSFLVATDMHATEAMNQQWSPFCGQMKLSGD